MSTPIETFDLGQVCESPIEVRLAVALVAALFDSGVEATLRPQYVHGAYRLDFLLTGNGRKVCIECDGHNFHERTAEQAQRDRSRDRALTAEGFTVLRFTGREINMDAEACAQEVVGHLGPMAARPPTSRQETAAEEARARGKRLDQQVLLAGLIAGGDLGDLVAGSVVCEEFSDPTCRLIYGAVLDMRKAGTPHDLCSVTKQLSGDPAIVAELVHLPTSDPSLAERVRSVVHVITERPRRERAREAARRAVLATLTQQEGPA